MACLYISAKFNFNKADATPLPSITQMAGVRAAPSLPLPAAGRPVLGAVAPFLEPFVRASMLPVEHSRGALVQVSGQLLRL